MVSLLVHELPEDIDVQILPLLITAASFVPSSEEVIDIQFFVDPTEESSTQVEVRQVPLATFAYHVWESNEHWPLPLSVFVSQNKPVDSEHMLEPQAHSAVFIILPCVLAHG